MGWAGPAALRRLVAEIPQVRRNEDEQKNERHENIVVDVAARVCPVEVALQNLPRAAS